MYRLINDYPKGRLEMSRLNFPMDEIDSTTISSARQLAEITKRAEVRHQAQTQVFQSQLDMAQSISIQQKQISEMSLTILELLKHIEFQAKQNEIKEKLEARRFKINTLLAFIAAVTGVIALIK